MEISEISSVIKEYFRKPENSQNIYNKPFPIETKVSQMINNPLEGSHKGPFKGAIDFIVPLETPVLAAYDGIVTDVVDSNDRYGPCSEFAEYLNYITVKHNNGEFSQVAHLEKGSVTIKIGDKVIVGQQIAKTGNSGWMSEPHLHFIVFKSAPTKDGFVGLTPKFK